MWNLYQQKSMKKEKLARDQYLKTLKYNMLLHQCTKMDTVVYFK